MMCRTLFAAAAVVAGSTILLACSSTSGGADVGAGRGVTVSLSTSCPAFTACGGDPTGRWNLTAACVAAVPPVSGCPTATVSGTLTLSGGVQFDTSTFGNSIRVSDVHITINLPGSCAHACNTPLSSLDPNYNRGSCGTATSSGCTCFDDWGGSNGFADSYTIDLDAGTVSNAGNTPLYYCVTGSTLQMQNFPVLSGPNLPNVITFTR